MFSEERRKLWHSGKICPNGETNDYYTSPRNNPFDWSFDGLRDQCVTACNARSDCFFASVFQCNSCSVSKGPDWAKEKKRGWGNTMKVKQKCTLYGRNCGDWKDDNGLENGATARQYRLYDKSNKLKSE